MHVTSIKCGGFFVVFLNMCYFVMGTAEIFDLIRIRMHYTIIYSESIKSTYSWGSPKKTIPTERVVLYVYVQNLLLRFYQK